MERTEVEEGEEKGKGTLGNSLAINSEVVAMVDDDDNRWTLLTSVHTKDREVWKRARGWRPSGATAGRRLTELAPADEEWIGARKADGEDSARLPECTCPAPAALRPILLPVLILTRKYTAVRFTVNSRGREGVYIRPEGWVTALCVYAAASYSVTSHAL